MEKITYSVYGWTDKTSWAVFSKKGYTENGAKAVFSAMKNSGKYSMVTMRKDTEYGYCNISVPIEEWEI